MGTRTGREEDTGRENQKKDGISLSKRGELAHVLI